MHRIFCLVFLFSYSIVMWGQTTRITSFVNASFEDIPGANRIPVGWSNCGGENYSPPDVHPDFSFQVHQSASHGETYLGLVAREDSSIESVGQKLGVPLITGLCYQVSLDLCRSEFYKSYSLLSKEEVNFNNALRLNIWGGSTQCEPIELLATSSAIDHFYWERYTFNLYPEKDYQYIIFEVGHESENLAPQNGNLLLDNLSSIEINGCDQNEPKVFVANPRNMQEILRELDRLDFNKSEAAYHEDESNHTIPQTALTKYKRETKAGIEVMLPDTIFGDNIDPYETISRYGEWVEFNDYNRLVRHQIYWKNRKKKSTVNAGLYVIARCVSKIGKNERIIFSVKGHGQGTRNGRRKRIFKTMKALNVPWTKMTVGSYRAPEALKVDWLYENDYVAIGIE